ncbi:unnamed protein product [Phaedon cochleariae]|uniref:Multidrug resistance-associated protein lethal(2)03659 n=1 Tax=Phaedon cochleariae TaxID=80249 RepID=A0A9N9SMB4_PHACE|nr:unnamed protein product [Phaedon cochleariae]
MEEVRTSNSNRMQHPVNTNICNRIFFCWFLPYLKQGLRKEIDEDDMFAVTDSQKSAYLSTKLERAWNNELQRKTTPSLLRALFTVFKVELIYYGVFFIVVEFVKIGQPMLISKLVSFYGQSDTKINKLEVYTYAAIIVLSSLAQIICNHNYTMGVMTLGMKIRTAACSLIYRKALKLSKTALAETTVGQMVNLLSNDVGRFDFAVQNLHQIWMAPIETIIITYLVHSYVGFTGLVGAIFLLSFIPFQMYMARMTSRYRLRTAIRTDERVRLMNEIISGIQVIKMYTWEKPFAKIVEIAREREIAQIRVTSSIRAIMLSCGMIMSRAAIFLCILTYVLTGNTLTATYAYTITSFYGHLRIAVTVIFPQGITQFAESRVSVKRIQQFLMYDEIENPRSISNDTRLPSPRISLKNSSFKWLKSSLENTLSEISFEASSKQMVALVGPVGCGKTTLLHVILKEIIPVSGSVHVAGTISYASQEPWLFGASVRQNILFGQEYDQEKYEEVVRVCALERDFTIFPNGDKTLVGERGVSLSGGQRARINLARTVYKEADIYLLDDPLSAVDTHVGEQLFHDCICGYLSSKCVVLVTHQLQYLRNSPHIYLLEDGKIKASGSYQQMKKFDRTFDKLLEESVDEERKCEEKRLSKSNIEKLKDSPVVAAEREKRSSGVVTWNVYKSYLKSRGGWFKAIALLSGFVLTEVFGSLTDYFVNIWVNLEQRRSLHSSLVSKLPEARNSTFGDTWSNEHLTDEINLYIYCSLVILFVITTFTRSISFFKYCMTASTRLHNNMFSKIVNLPMRFFNTNPSGRILNRFAKDVGAVDETLPITLLDTLGIGLTVLAISIVIGTMNPWILTVTGVMLVIFYFLRQTFLVSSRNIKRVEAVTRSPIYTHLTASLQGLTTIRAFGAQQTLTREFDNFQDAYFSAYFMFLSANRGFGFWLDLHCVLYTACVTVSVLFIQNESLGGNVGLSLTQAMTLSGMFQWGIRQWTDLENQMTSVERIQEYADITPELDVNTKPPPKFWPEHGNLKFENMSLRYSEDMPYVLKKLCFEIKSREKIGIVGRTGAGKTSLIQALFRLAEIEGHIWVDGVDTKTVSLSVLRSKISIIPQEPVLFSGTLRKNLDPFDEYQDEVLWNALEEVELKNAVGELQSGLDSKMAEGGSNFSVGQRQLVCLARAIIRNNKILVMDEATANVDPHTDALIQNTIRRKFANCTVLTIAHRLHTIMDSDKVLVMDAGQAVEFGHPFSLLQNKQGTFYGLVKQTGSAMAQSLQAIAEEAFMKTK